MQMSVCYCFIRGDLVWAVGLEESWCRQAFLTETSDTGPNNAHLLAVSVKNYWEGSRHKNQNAYWAEYEKNQ